MTRSTQQVTAAGRQTISESTELAVDNRYDRQQRIEGWDQRKINAAKITIIGSDILAQQIAMSSAAIGFGTIEIYGTGIQEQQEPGILNIETTRTTRQEEQEITKTKSLENIITKINPDITIRGINIDASRNTGIIGKTGLIIETTNNIESKAEIIQYAIDTNTPLISVSSDSTKAKIGYLPANTEERSRRQDVRSKTQEEREKLISNLYFPEFNGTTQGNIPSQLIAGIATDEARKIFMLLPNEKTLEDIVIYNKSSTQRVGNENDITLENMHSKSLQDYKILMIGAGALGIMAGIQLAIHGIGELAIVDFDTVETTNLNRQILHYDAVGQQKAESLAKKLRQINPDIKVKTKNEKITLESETQFKKGHYDAIIDGVDNNKTRALLNYYSLKYNIPLISGGTRYNGGQVTLSIPETNACLNCQADIDRLAQADHRPASCIYAPTPSVITSNQIIGAAMIGEVYAILKRKENGKPITSTFKYAANEDLRLKLMPPAKETCECYKDEKMLEEWPEKMKHLYETSGRERTRTVQEART